MTDEKRKHGLWWWIDRYRKSSAFVEMTLAEQGAYRNLLDYQRLSGGLIPNDERTLAKACGDPLEWPAVREKVLRWFQPTPDGKHLHNRTATEVNAVTDGLSEARATSGRKGFEKVARGESGRFTGKTGKATGKATGQRPGKTDGQSTAYPLPLPLPLPLSVAVTDNGNNGSGANAPAAETAGGEPPPTNATPAEATARALAVLGPPPKRKTWLTRPGDLWHERWGNESEPPWDEMAQQFSRPVKAFEGRGELDELWARWERFLAASTTSQYARPARFIQGLGEWAEGAQRPAARASPPTVGERAIAESQKFINAARRGGKA